MGYACHEERAGGSLHMSNVYLPKPVLSRDSDEVMLSGYRSRTEAEKDMVESPSSWLA